MTKYEWDSELKKRIYRLPADETKRVIEYYDEIFNDKAERGEDEREIIAQFGNPAEVADKILDDYYDSGAANNRNVVPTPEFSDKIEVVGKHSAKSNSSVPPPKFVVVNSKGERVDIYNKDNEPKNPNVNKPSEQHIDEQPKKDEPKIVGAKAPTKSQERKLSGSRLAWFVVFAVLFGGAFIGLSVGLWAVVVGVGSAGLSCTVAGIVGLFPAIGAISVNGAAAAAQIGILLCAVGLGTLLIVLTVKLVKLGIYLTKKLFHWVKLAITEKKVQYEN